MLLESMNGKMVPAIFCAASSSWSPSPRVDEGGSTVMDLLSGKPCAVLWMRPSGNNSTLSGYCVAPLTSLFACSGTQMKNLGGNDTKLA